MILIKKIINYPIRTIIYFIENYLYKFKFQKKIFHSSNLKEKNFIISFDCDTQKDVDCLNLLLGKLNEINIKIILAIPAQLIKKNINLIKNLKESFKIEFLNHGYHIHTEFREIDKSYISTLSYNDKNFEFIKEDILLAHKFLVNELNYKPEGFRAPHFGEVTFNQKKKIFKYLKKLNYIYSSSSIYDLAITKGSIFKLNGITEFTVTGRSQNITKMMDSWSFLDTKNDTVVLKNEYSEELKKIEELFNEKNYNYLNLYADPSHVIESEYFYKFLKNLSQYNSSFIKIINQI